MTKDHVLIGDFGSISDNGTFSVNFPLVGAYADPVVLTLDDSGDPVAIGTEITGISLRAGTEQIIQPVTPAFLAMRALYCNASKGYTAITGATPIDLTPMNIFNARERMAYMLGTRGIPSLQMEISTGTLANVASVQIWARHLIGGEFDMMGLGRHIRISKETITSTGTGLKEWDQFPYINSTGVGLLAMHFANAAGTGTINKLKVETNNRRVDLVPVAVEQAWQRQAGRTPQSNFWQKDFALINSPIGFLPLSSVVRLKATLNWSVNPAAEHSVYVETLHGIDEAKGY